jgi:DNA-binding NarL/FixJ family response regulator
MKIRVLLVEDHRMVREALREVLTKVNDIEVVGEAGDAREGLELAESLSPDVIVLDIRLPDLNGIEVAARLRDAGTTVTRPERGLGLISIKERLSLIGGTVEIRTAWEPAPGAC